MSKTFTQVYPRFYLNKGFGHKNKEEADSDPYLLANKLWKRIDKFFGKREKIKKK